MACNELPSGALPDTEEIVSHEQDEERGIYDVASNEQEMETNCGVSDQKEEKIDKKENDDLPVVLRQKNLGEQQRSKKLDSVNSRDLISFILRSRTDYYTKEKRYSVFCGTWNVNGQDPPNKDLLRTWFNEKRCSPEQGENPDIFVIGFQEVGKFVWGEMGIESKWSRAVKEALPAIAGDVYREVKLIRMTRIMMIVYVKESLMTEDLPQKPIAAGIVATSIMGSKGGVGVRISIHNTTLCFINTHLAAHQEEVEKRNEGFLKVEKKMTFEKINWKIVDHDIVFWIGDLNYRIDDMDINDVKEKISRNEYSDILPNDQLVKQLAMDAFEEYSEGDITFKPTYKYDKDSNNWDTSPKKRTPAWCDRILYKGAGIEQVHYISHPDLMISDHKPVSSLFHVAVKVKIKEKCDKLEDGIKNFLQQNKPKVTVIFNAKELEFEDVLFFEARSARMEIKNNGPGPVEFEFAKCKPWITVEPSGSVIDRGSSCEIWIQVLVDETCAASMKASNYDLSDTLKLSFRGGEIKNITVKGNLMLSSFGYPLDDLNDFLQPFRYSISKAKTELHKDRLSVPKEVMRLTRYILDDGKIKEDLFQQGGVQEELKDIINCLDTTLEPEPIPGSINSVAEALLLFLKLLPEPVIPSSKHDKCLNVCSEYKSCIKVIEKIPQFHRYLFASLCDFLKELVQSDKNEVLDIKKISFIFGEVLMRPSSDKLSSRNDKEDEDNQKKAEFLAHFIRNGSKDIKDKHLHVS